MGALTTPQSGTTLPPSTAASIVAKWISSLVDFHAPPSALPARKKGSTTTGGSSRKSSESFAKLNPDGSFSRTSGDFCQQMLDGSSEKFSEGWPVSGSMRSGSVFRQKTWVPAMSGRGCSSSPSEGTAWTTPCADDTGNRKKKYAQGGTPLSMQGAQWPTPYGFQAGNGPDGNEFSTKVRETVESWPTPRAGALDSTRPNGKGGKLLAEQAKTWPTPTVSNPSNPNSLRGQDNLQVVAEFMWPTPRTITGGGESAQRKKELGRDQAGGGDLQAAVESWPTPQAHDVTTRGNTMADGHYRPHDLSNATESWPTPNARDHKGSDLESRNGGASLSHFTETGERTHPPAWATPKAVDGIKPSAGSRKSSDLSHQVQTTSGGRTSSPDSPISRLRLNPAFVCWLMGAPWWWTRAERISFASEEMASWLFRARRLLWSLIDGSERD